ncbi:MAG TPA: DUF5916 domain-containing protein, partial [Gemmatimonadales bacterium]|nr:DUF5916 domain-containing protein [Gemmatimonadales bacterium]
PNFGRTVSGWQYVDQPAEVASPTSVHFVTGRLDQATVSLTARADFAFSRNMTLQLYAQPFLSAGSYTDFKEVRDPRASKAADRVVPYATNQIAYEPTDRTYGIDLDGDAIPEYTFANPDFNQKNFNLNMVWRWEYRPGSTIYLVWTQARDVPGTNGNVALGSGLDALFQGPATNVLLGKVSYRFGF